jgi:hypothetical protein
MTIKRRSFLTAATVALGGMRSIAGEAPIRAITRGPRFHWFGYYDKLQFDPASRYALGCEGTIEHRLNNENDILRIGMVDTQDKDRWIELGDTRAWSWHQTCMLQWLPQSSEEIIWNDREDGQFVSHILNVRTHKKRTLPSAIYAVSPDGTWGVVADFRRTRYLRPETGYAGLEDPNREVLAPENSGIWRVDLKTGRTKLILPLSETLRVPLKQGDWTGFHHYFDHLLIAPDGKRIVFLQRWSKPGVRGFSTRMFTVNPDGSQLHLLDPHGKTSHFIWRDRSHLLAWTWQPGTGDHFYLFEDKTGKVTMVAPDVLKENGHISYLPGGRFLLTDTAPDTERKQKPALYDFHTNQMHVLGALSAAPEYTGVWRCDTTPRFSPDARKVIVDSPHGGNGRQMYLIDVSHITKVV